MTQHEIKYKLLRELGAGGLSCMVASALLNPMDVAKVRLQTQNQLLLKGGDIMYFGLSHTVKRIIAEEGLIGLWIPGMTASMLRELSYSSIRMGLYGQIRSLYSIGSKGEDPGLLRKILSGLTTGAIGSAIANPTDLVKIRLQCEAGVVSNGLYVTGLRKGYPPTYKNTFSAFVDIFKNEGIAGLYRGTTATIARASLVTAGQMASYDHTKHVLKSNSIMNEGFNLHIIASLVSGLCATTAAAPADIIKTRIMNDRKLSKGNSLYKGPLDCMIKTIKHEGVRGLFRGWLPSYFRLGPHFVISFPLFEQIRRLFGLGYS